jgi:hypothetical protein
MCLAWAWLLSRPDDVADYERGSKAPTAPLRRRISPQYAPSAAKQRAVALMIVETFFLVEEKRAICTRIFQDLVEHAAFGSNSGVCAGQSGA